MKQFSSTVAKIKNASGQYEAIPALRGATPYEIAVRNGFEGTEEEWYDLAFDEGWVTKYQELEAKLETKADKSEVPSPAQIIVSTREGSEITCTNADNVMIEPLTRGTEWIFPTTQYGTYTVTGGFGSMTRIKTVDVTSMAQYNVELEWYEDTFADNDWDTIAEVCGSGVIPETWNVGDSKTLDSSTIRIIGKEHDVYENGDTAPFTFMFETGYLHSCTMNPNNTGDNSWTNSNMRNNTIPNKILSLSISDKIKSVKKLTSAGNESNEITVTYDRGFLLSEVEWMGTCTKTVAGEGSQYEYFSAGNRIPAALSDGAMCWTRSPSSSSSNNTVTYCFDSNGEPIAGENQHWICSSFGAYAYPAFCL